MKYLAQFLYQSYLNTHSKILAKCYFFARKILLRLANPIIVLKFRGFKLAMPFSHMIFASLKAYPSYDMQLYGIAKHIYKQYGRLDMVDIGANIGDTVCFTQIQDATYLMVEGEPSYARLIAKNLAYNFKGDISIGGGHNKPSFLLYTALLGESALNTSNTAYRLHLQDGSGKLIPSKTLDSTSIITLDELITTSGFVPNFIKIDTDGFDFKILRGAKNTLLKHKPVLFFEWDRQHLEAQGENPLSIFPFLETIGYHMLLIFDNFGTLLCKLSSKDTNNLALLIEYTIHSKQHIYYYDVLALHKESLFCPEAYLATRTTKPPNYTG